MKTKRRIAQVAFGTWHCNCTLLAETLDAIPSRCPTHNVRLLGPATMESNPKRVALGLRPDHRIEASR